MGPIAIGALMDGMVIITAIICLVYYCTNRKWNKDELNDAQLGKMKLIVRYRVEIILTIVIVPAAWELVSSFIPGGP